MTDRTAEERAALTLDRATRADERQATLRQVRARIDARISVSEAVDRMPPLTVALRIIDALSDEYGNV